MCEPATIIAAVSTALNIGATIAGARAQDEQASAVRNAANNAARLEVDALDERQTEETIATLSQINQTRRQTIAARGAVAASAAEAGVSGNSVEALDRQFTVDEGDLVASQERNLQATLRQIQRNKGLALAGAQQRINQAPPSSGLATGLRIGGSLVDGANTLLSRRPPSDGPTSPPPVTLPKISVNIPNVDLP